MPDANVIGMDGRGRSTRTVLAGADRASGERARRRQRTTPLLQGPPGPAAHDASAIAPHGAAPKDLAPKDTAPKDTAPKDILPKETAPKGESVKDAAERKQPGRKQVAPKRRAAAKPASAKPAAAKKASATKTAATKTPATKTAVPKTPGAKISTPRFVTAADRPASNRPASDRPASERRAPVTQLPTAFQLDDGPLPAGGKHSVAKALLAQAGEALLEAVVSRARPAQIEEKVASILSFVTRRLTGEYELDEFGFDPEFAEAVPLALVKPLYKYWFRVEVRGIENIPAEGGALIVANHSGALPMDAVMTAVAVHEAHPQHRFLRTLGADLVFQTPFLAGLARRAGATLASNPDAERLLSGGHVVGVWPEGFKGIGKPFSERYKLQRFGRGGFVSAALRTGTPIVPCSIVGAEEIFPIIADIPSLARLFGLPYVPITPFFPLLGPLGAIPLPSKWLIEFGPPVPTHEYGPHAADDPMLVFDLTDQVRQSIQQTLYSLLVQRRSIFF